MKIDFLKDEYWWGGLITEAENMPYDCNTVFCTNLATDRVTQSAPLYLSSKGRYIWSEEPFTIEFNKGVISITSDFEVFLTVAGETLREAYIDAMKNHFPFKGDIRTPREFYEHPQFNTWMELIKNQNQKDIISYAEEIIENGYKPGILIIDGGWQICQGTWEVNRELMPNPKAMTDCLHQLGFTVMIWVSPFMCSEGKTFLDLYVDYAVEGEREKAKYNHLLRHKNGKPAIQQWWSGYGAIYNFMLPDDCLHMDKQLRHLMDDYGFDGFKFDGGAYTPQSFICGTDFYGDYTVTQLNDAWMNFASSYKFHEVKDSWKQGGKPIIQRLLDKRHSWDDNGLNCLIPHGCFMGIIGSPFVCPDMVGSGSWTAFIDGSFDEELFVRMAECSALFPMMQFSSLPWRHLSKKAQTICKNMAELHEKMYPEMEKILSDSERTGEPIIRSMEYMYPNCGYEKINDQFTVGEDILVAPVIKKGDTTKKVYIPTGRWIEQNTGDVYNGPCEVNVNAPLEILPWFKKQERYK